MALSASPETIASQARRLYTEELVKGLVDLVQAALEGARSLLDKPSEHATFQRRRDLLQGLNSGAQAWHRGIVTGLRQVLLGGVSDDQGRRMAAGRFGARHAHPGVRRHHRTRDRHLAPGPGHHGPRQSWEFADLRSRVAYLENRNELDPHDMLRAHVLARIVFEAWCGSAQTLDSWRELQTVLHEEFALLVEEAYHETNRWLVAQGVLPEVDLRPFIRRSRTHPNATTGLAGGHWPEPGRRRPGASATASCSGRRATAGSAAMAVAAGTVAATAVAVAVAEEVAQAGVAVAPAAWATSPATHRCKAAARAEASATKRA